MTVISPAYTAYRVFVCADCHPDQVDEKTPEDERYELPSEVVFPIDGTLVQHGRGHASCPINNCPRCGSHLPWCAEDVVTVVRA